MHLYQLTLQRATTITHAVHGNFSGNSKQQEIIISRGKILELLRPDPNTGKVHSLLTHDVFGVIRSMMPFRLVGGSKDFLIVGSDSGRIVILEYLPAKNQFEKLHQETFGKSGCRRIVPGQYLAVDPKGRAVMIGAVEKQKLVYILNRDAQARLTISSPLEAHKGSTLVYHMVGVDVAFENPTFACLEMDYEAADNDHSGQAAVNTKQSLTYYELDLGLNHVVRKFSESLDEHANLLLAVPGGNDGPSGVLVCAENYVTYKKWGEQPDIRCPIPRRRNDLDDPERGMLIVCAATHRTKHMFFFLIQTEQGDVFKLTLETDEDMVTEMRMKYFDTLPVAAAMCVLKTGFLYVAAEFGQHALYQIAHLADDEEEPEFSSSMPLDDGDTFFFAPRELTNLVLVDEIDSLAPLIHSAVADLANEDAPQIYAACGRGPRSSLRVLRHGLEVTEMAVSELPGNPNAVWTVRKTSHDSFDAYIIVSFVNATLVLSIGDTVEEVTDSGFLGTTPTLACSSLGDDALVQVYPHGIRHIRADRRVNEWKTPGKKAISKCALNDRQVVIALSQTELVYFEMDSSGQLNEYTERTNMPSDIVSMCLSKVPQDEQRCRFLAVGLSDNTVRLISLDPHDCLSPLAMQALPALAESLCMLEVRSDLGGKDDTSPRLMLNMGLHNGVLLRSQIDRVTGDLSDTRTRYLGSRPVKLFIIKVQGQGAVLAVSSRSWLSYSYHGRQHLTPLSYEALEYAAGFSSEQCPEGVVAIATNTLRILALDKLGVVFNHVSTKLSLTPRKFVLHYETCQIVLIETDHNAYTDEVREQRKQQMAAEMVEAAGEEEQQLAAEMATSFLNEKLPDVVFGSPKAGLGCWASQIKIMNPLTSSIVSSVQLPQDEAAVSLSMLKFTERGGEMWFVVVGVVKKLILAPRSCESAHLLTYALLDNFSRLELVHKTPVEDVPGAMAPFEGRLLVGVGKLLRIYDLGKKKLLRKCENKHLPYQIVSITSMGSRIVVGDVQESIHWLRYKRRDNTLSIFCDDTVPRYITCCTLIDYSTVAAADKFGNVTILRLPNDVNDDLDDDPSGQRALWERGVLNGAPHKLVSVCEAHVGEMVTSLQKSTLVPGGSECVVYTTISGGIGVFVPLTSHEDYDFLQHLEMHMRQESSPLCGRDHLAFRSYYFPIRNVIDGDLCEMYSSLDSSKQQTIALELDRTPADVAKKLDDMRTRFAF